MTKIETAVSDRDNDPQTYVYMTRMLNRPATLIVENISAMFGFTKAVEKATTSLHALLEAYYLDREAEARWADDGGQG